MESSNILVLDLVMLEQMRDRSNAIAVSLAIQCTDESRAKAKQGSQDPHRHGWWESLVDESLDVVPIRGNDIGAESSLERVFVRK